MTTSLDVRILELLCSRLCHDLVSPVGAINNGIELIEELEEGEAGGPMGREALGLIAHSAAQASRRLRLFRLAYGAAGSEGAVAAADLRSAVTAYFGEGRIAVDWAEGALPLAFFERRGAGKVLLNLALLAEEALAYGGRIRVGASDAAPASAALAVQGRAAGLRPDALEALEGRTAPGDLTPRTVQAYVTGRFAEHFGLRVTAEQAGPELLMLGVEGGRG